MPTVDPDHRRLARVLALARFDAWSLMAVATPAAGAALVAGNRFVALVATGVALCGLVEFRGRARLQARDAAGVYWLVGAQLACLYFIVAYAWVQACAPTPDHLLSLLPSFSRETLAELFPDPAEVRWLLRRLQQLIAAALAVAALGAQGGMALFYACSRARLRRCFAAPPLLAAAAPLSAKR